jgi:hypothetical protein
VRAVWILATLAFVDVLLVAIGGVAPSQPEPVIELRHQLLGIVAMAGAGCVALAALSFAMHVAMRHRFAMVRVASSLLSGLVVAVIPVALVAWTWLWLTPTHYPVAIVCGASALLLLWQGFDNAGAVSRHHQQGE